MIIGEPCILVFLPRSSSDSWWGSGLSCRVFAPCDVQKERVRLRAKQFWNARKVREVREQTLPALTHEHDGLIFQSWNDAYTARTDSNLLKYKYPNLNSVEFLILIKEKPEANIAELHVQDKGDKTVHIAKVDETVPLNVVDLEGSPVVRL